MELTEKFGSLKSVNFKLMLAGAWTVFQVVVATRTSDTLPHHEYCAMRAIFLSRCIARSTIRLWHLVLVVLVYAGHDDVMQKLV